MRFRLRTLLAWTILASLVFGFVGIRVRAENLRIREEQLNTEVGTTLFHSLQAEFGDMDMNSRWNHGMNSPQPEFCLVPTPRYGYVYEPHVDGLSRIEMMVERGLTTRVVIASDQAYPNSAQLAGRAKEIAQKIADHVEIWSP